jgi:PAS domain S-box-containing protein
MQKLADSVLVAALQETRVGICILDQNGKICFANSAFASKFETTVAAIAGTSYLGLFKVLGKHPQFHSVFAAAQPELACECAMELPSGYLRYAFLQANTITIESLGRYRVVNLMDVTDYGVTRDRLKQLHSQIDAMNNSVVIVDAQSPDMPIVYVNAHFERMTGYSKSETIGRNCRFLQGSEHMQPALQTLRDAIRNQRNCHVSLKNFRKNGTPFQNELFVSPVFNEKGVLTHFIGVQHESVSFIQRVPVQP